MKHELSDIDPQKMDSQKWDLLLDLLEHPEKYSERGCVISLWRTLFYVIYCIILEVS